MARFKFCSLAIVVSLIAHSFCSFGQNEKKSIKLDLGYSRINELAPELKATAKSKTGKKFEPVEGVEVEFFSGEQSPGNSLGKRKTNRKGIASIELSSTVASKLESESSFKFTAFVKESDNYNEQSTEIEITNARLELSLTDVDHTKEVGAKLVALKEGKWAEVPEVDVKLFVRRILGDLSLSEKALTTDDAGDVSASFEFKTLVPGDANGNIIIGAKVEDNDNYGTIATLKSAKWGAAQKPDRSFYERSLWASRDKTPVWLLIFPNLIIVTVWGFIFYMCYLIFRIRKVGLEQK